MLRCRNGSRTAKPRAPRADQCLGLRIARSSVRFTARITSTLQRAAYCCARARAAARSQTLQYAPRARW
eukprot:8235091-Lingulodinium_polyedra.AAC.1